MSEQKTGLIICGVGGRYTIRMADGSLVYVRARGAFRHSGATPLVGDTVDVGLEPDGSGKILSIHPRKNQLIRPPMANLDILFAVVAAANPAPSTLVLDKLLTVADFLHISPVVIITKTDLGGVSDQLLRIYQGAGFPVFSVSTEEDEGFASLSAYIAENCKGKLSCFAGASGVGKSTLTNRLFPHLQVAVGDTSHRIERGKQTTRHVELFPLSDQPNCGYLADTPGFGMLDFVHFDFYRREDLPYTFREFLPHLPDCRYTDCTHTKEEECGIRQALARGEIAPERYESFLAIYEELKDKRPWDRAPKGT